ncbi:hypothetical protein RIF29_19195 [Crotalaria pallida]|uniref:Uncharacterized protein n=1 Tax=Crotalaria pallida TaxID=3830 RepID=A0AAN9EZJ7_CROPI
MPLLLWQMGALLGYLLCEGLANWDYASDSAKFNNWERFLVLQNESGLRIVRATVTGFPDSLGEDTFHEFPTTENVLTDAIRLQLVSSLRVDLEFSLIYFNPNAQVNLSITCGSCFLEAITNDSEVVDVIQPPSGLQCLQLVLSPKGLGIANLTVYDIGLTPPLRAFALVQVADIEWIKIIPGEEISLMIHQEIRIGRGRKFSNHLSAGINDGSSFPASQFVYMNLHVHVEDSIIELVDTDNFSSQRRAAFWRCSAKSSYQGGGLCAPRILSSDIFLLPGASYVLTMQGGPTLGGHIDYSILAISFGNTTIHACIFVNGNTVICEARSILRVGVPSTVILHTQNDQLGVSNILPIYPLFPEVLNFKAEGSLLGEKFEIKVTASDEGQVGGYLDESDIRFINVLYGRSAGKTNVAVSFSCALPTSG